MRPLFNTVKLDPLRLFFSPNLLIRRKTTLVSLPSFTCPNKTLTRIQTPGVFHCKEMATVSSESAAGAVVQVKDKIELTEVEKQIFDRFVNTLHHFSLHTELRVAGGWVRDKLLGKECYDIDIAIDNMSGSEFVDKVREYLLSTGEEAHGVGIIPRNPDQSKHLETARMRLLDLWIDFVNLRSEDYSENSRIPTMTFGTAKEDAYRRDLTINSLFYNINTGSVEDLTGRGIEDLKSGKIVTPLPPKDTFLDDPLRVLRAIRFGARFGFVFEEELTKAAACDDVKNALAAKVSKERVGTEIDLMISGNQPVKAMTYIADLTLFWVVFTLHPKVEPTVSEECQGLCVAYLDAAWNLIQLIGGSSFTGEQRRLCLYAALFLPFRDTIYKDGKGKKVPVVNCIFRDSLKQKASDPETVIKIHRSLEKFLALIPLLTSNDDTQPAEVDMGMELFDVPITSKLRVATGFLLLEVKEFWRAGLLLSTLLYPSDTDSTQDFLEKQFELDRRRDLFKAAEDAIVNLGLEKVWDLKPLVNGKDIMTVLHLKSGGPIVREWQQKLLAWQLAHPVRDCGGMP
ncbi:TRNA-NUCLEOTIDYLTRANSFERASE [Salix koriyanagi]|uniref:tRNA-NUCLEOTIDYLTRANSFERASE n=2 Tax=Salix koriyanagi TaxID=2511006 RepID=A0A9Q1A4H1_9ROSI|nr:TRNA-NUCLEOTIDYLTRANSFERASE [Salix koriyanagi]